MKTITFVYDTDTEDEGDAIEEARIAIMDHRFEPFSVVDEPEDTPINNPHLNGQYADWKREQYKRADAGME